MIRVLPLLSAFSKARDIFHESPEQGRELALLNSPDCNDFYSEQAAVTAAFLGAPDPAQVQLQLEKHFYRGWESYFKKIKPYSHVKQCLEAFKSAGLKLGLLSDFPVETKIKHLGIDSYWDAVLCSEDVGALKPDPRPFLKLAEALGTEPSKILYVGNKVKYDVAGAKRAGMESALISRKKQYRNSSANTDVSGAAVPAEKPAAMYGAEQPDFVFFDYRKLIDFVLN